MAPARDGWTARDLRFARLQAAPPQGFDCGREDQNQFLYREALESHLARISSTFLGFVRESLFGYVTLAPDSIELLARQRPREFRKYPRFPALKILQMAVDARFQGMRLGVALVDFAVGVALETEASLPFRFVTLDAVPEQVRFYQRQGFVRSELRDGDRRARLAARGVDPSHLATSMHMDLTERF